MCQAKASTPPQKTLAIFSKDDVGRGVEISYKSPIKSQTAAVWDPLGADMGIAIAKSMSKTAIIQQQPKKVVLACCVKSCRKTALQAPGKKLYRDEKHRGRMRYCVDHGQEIKTANMIVADD